MRKRGFTLLELIIVIGIIAIMASILFPLYARSREAARRASCASNLQQIGLALNLYAQNYNGHYPEEDNEFGPLLHYSHDQDMFWCPSDSDKQPWTMKAALAPVPAPVPARTPVIGPPAPGAVPPGPAPAPGAPSGVPPSKAPTPAPPPPSPPASALDDESEKIPVRTFSSYAYKGGLMNDDRADTRIASEAKAWHKDLANVLYLSGQVKGRPARGFKPVVTPRPVPSYNAPGGSGGG